MTKSFHPLFYRWSLATLLMAALFLTGCRTSTETDPAGHLASLTITGHSEADILRALQAVLFAHGYQHVSDLNFDKKGAIWQTALYGGWANDGVWIRVKASLDPGPDGSYVIGCDVFRVTAHNAGVMEEERKAAFGYRDECRSILQEVQSRLAAAPEAPTTP